MPKKFDNIKQILSIDIKKEISIIVKRPHTAIPQRTNDIFIETKNKSKKTIKL